MKQMTMNWYSVIGLLILTIILSSCGSDNTQSQAETTVTKVQLAGRWDLVECYRDGQPTGTLKDVFFDFSDELLETNIPSIEGKGTYTLEDNVIQQELSDKKNRFIIQAIDESTLTITTNVQRFRFEFQLTKMDAEQ